MNRTAIAFIAALLIGATACAGLLGIPDEGALTPPGDDASVDGGALRDVAAETDAPALTCNTASDPENCGYCGHSCLGGECRDGACLPYRLVKDMPKPAAYTLALIGETLYAEEQSDCAILAVDRKSGQVSKFGDSGCAGDLIVDGTYVYWTQLLEADPEQSRLVRCKAAGCAATGPETVLPSFNNVGLTPNLWLAYGGGGRLFYFLSEEGHDDIESIAGDGTGRRVIAHRPGSDVRELIVDGSYVYWTEGAAGILRAPVEGLPEGGAPEKMVDATAGPIAFDAERMIFSAKGALWALPRSEFGRGTPTPIAPFQDNVAAILIRDEYAYWAAGRESSAVRRCALPACAPIETIAKDLEFTDRIAIDESALYFNEMGNDNGRPTLGAIWRWAR